MLAAAGLFESEDENEDEDQQQAGHCNTPMPQQSFGPDTAVDDPAGTNTETQQREDRGKIGIKIGTYGAGPEVNEKQEHSDQKSAIGEEDSDNEESIAESDGDNGDMVKEREAEEEYCDEDDETSSTNAEHGTGHSYDLFDGGEWRKFV